MNKKNIWKVMGVLLVMSGVVLWGSVVFYKNRKAEVRPVAAEAVNLPEMTTEELGRHDGIIEATIYMGVEGLVYDVTAGKRFYEKDGPYHYLVAKDATEDLKLVGTGIITNKYPAIARMKK